LAIAYTDYGYPDNTTSSCTATCVKDDLGFCQNNCTSYAAYVLKEVYGVPFSNSYKGVVWSHGGNWNNAAGQISGQNIAVDNYPIPGDVAYWEYDWTGDPNNHGDDHGHVAFVEKVRYDNNGNATGIEVSEYNYSPSCILSTRSVNAQVISVESNNYPSGFIHILAYEEGVSGLYYLDSYETNSPSQTKQEWGWILSRVWNSYRCKNCDSDYDLAYINTISNAVGGMGGGAGYETPATDPPTPNLTDFITKKVWLETPWGTETYKYGNQETVKMKAQFENIGDGFCSGDIEVHFYLSKGYKEDSHTEWKRVGTDFIHCSNLGPNQTHTETEGIELWRDIPESGIWNITAYIDHIRDDHNNGGAHPEKHESNNGSTESVFEVTANSIENQDPRFVDFITSGLHFRGTSPYYAGDQAHFGAWVTNRGNITSPSDIRSSYSVQCSGTGRVYLADDGTQSSTLTAGASAFEENIGAVALPSVAGSCIAYFCADYQGAVAESDETNNCTTLNFNLQPRPKPKLVIAKFQDESGCCTTNTGSRIKPDIWVRNDGPVSPATDVQVLYQISSPVATGGQWRTIGYGSIRPSELPSGGTDEDYMDGSWSVPKNSAWKNQWHTIRGCLKADGIGTPTGGQGEVCATYGRYSKK
jgi:surface antigen